MSIFLSLSALALRPLAEGACNALGKRSGEGVTDFLMARFADQGQRLTAALRQANDRAWQALEIALAGDSLLEWCQALIARAEDRALAQQVRAFLDAAPLPELAGKNAFRQKCLEELRAARKARLLDGESPEAGQLAPRAADFARFGDPAALLQAEWRVVAALAEELKGAGYPSLAWLLSQRPSQGLPLPVLAVRYFFRRCVEEDQKLFQGFGFAGWKPWRKRRRGSSPPPTGCCTGSWGSTSNL